MIKDWRYGLEVEKQEVVDLASQLNIDVVVARLLLQRGINSLEEARTFFRPTLDMLHDPFSMADMDKAVGRLNDAIFKEEKILVYGDYDVDGTTSVALVYNFLHELGLNLDTYIPDRYIEGYGISKKGIDYAFDNNIKLVIALDCGISALEEMEYAAEKGVEFIICDHHLPGKKLPKAIAILDPKRNDCQYPFDGLSGCGVGFKFLQAFCIQNTIDLNRLYNYLDLVAVSIAADIVPMVDENRVLAYFGLKKINSAPIPGLQALIKIAGFRQALDISNVVFGIGPRINAAGRVSHAKSAVELLTSSNMEEALLLAEKLNINNNERKNYDESITHEALKEIYEDSDYKSKKSTVLFKEDWHKGVIGIVASRCVEKHYRPTIILTESNKKATGSARSVEGFDIHSAISDCADLLDSFGGHKYAAGLTMSLKNVESFKDKFEKVVSSRISEEELISKIHVDAEIDLSKICYPLFNILKQMGPFGPGNMQPVFVATNVVVKTKPKVLKDIHLKLFLGQHGSESSFDAIGFGFGEFGELLNQPFDIAFTIEENNYMGNKTLQLNLKDIRVTEDN